VQCYRVKQQSKLIHQLSGKRSPDAVAVIVAIKIDDRSRQQAGAPFEEPPETQECVSRWIFLIIKEYRPIRWPIIID
jgi:hypothetical protein